MAYTWQRWLPAEFRAAGLEVIEVAGWENRGRPASTGSYDPRGPLTVHHTASTTSPANPRPTLGLLITGRSDLPGPLAPYSTGADGKVTVIAAGRCNHAGPIGRNGVLGMPQGFDGNALAMGDEVDTNGTQTMPEAQRRSMAVAAAVVLAHFGKTPAWLHRHADISGSGKWDLGGVTTTQLRALVGAAHTALTQEDYMATSDAEKKLDNLTRRVDDLGKSLDTIRSYLVDKKGKVDTNRYRAQRAQGGKAEDLLERILAELDEDGGSSDPSPAAR